MTNWTISPCGEGVATPCSCEDGNFIISKNSPPGTHFTITYNSGETTKIIDYVRETDCVICECSDIIFEYKYHLDDKGRKVEERYFNVNDHNDVELGTITFKDGTNCSEIVKVSGDTGSTGFTEIKIVGDKVIASFPAYEQTFDKTGRRLRFRFTIKGTPCTNIYEIFQQAWKGTDNGMDYFANGFNLDYPILLCACGDAMDQDSIVAENGAWVYNPNDESFTKLAENEFKNKYPNGITVDGWCKFTFAEDNPGILNLGMIRIEALSSNPSNTETRTASIILSSVDKKNANPVKISADASADLHPGEECALKWSYDVVQLPRGYSMLYKDNGLDFYMLKNEELDECLNYNNCIYERKRNCRDEPYNCK